MRCVPAFLLLLVCIGSARASEPLAHEDPFANFRFPRQLGGYVFQNHMRYPRVELGYGLNYIDRGRATATISIYDLNTTGTPDGTSNARVREEFDKLNEAVAVMAREGGYQGMKTIETVPVLSKAWLQINHELVRADGRRSYMFSFIRAQNGKFVKILVTANSLESYERLPSLLLDTSRAIGLIKASNPN